MDENIILEKQQFELFLILLVQFGESVHLEIVEEISIGELVCERRVESLESYCARVLLMYEI